MNAARHHTDGTDSRDNRQGDTAAFSRQAPGDFADLDALLDRCRNERAQFTTASDRAQSLTPPHEAPPVHVAVIQWPLWGWLAIPVICVPWWMGVWQIFIYLTERHG